MKVRFSEKPEPRLVGSLLKHKDDIWFTGGEIRSFIRETALAGRQISSSPPPGAAPVHHPALYQEDTCSFLGLEAHLTPSTLRETRRRRSALVAAVMSEQRRQRLVGIRDPGRLALISRALSGWSVRRAGLIALIHCGGDGAVDAPPEYL